MNKIAEENIGASKASDSRDRQIIRASIIGIVANVLLAAFKAFIGLMSNSIAVILDAVNNLSDAASSIITIVGTKLAKKPADRKHPFGHGRAEYLSALVISLIVLYAGITSLEESVKKIIHPATPEYTPIALIIIAVAVITKIVLGRYVKSVGVKVHSDSLVNSGQDALLDSVISAATLIAAVIYLAAGISLEAWLGAIISVVIIKAGVDMIRETLSQILGERADADLAKGIKSTVCSFPDVSGAYDLVLNNYGPDKFIGSVHIEVPDTYSANELDDLIRNIQIKVMMEHNVILSAIGVYSVNTQDPKAIAMREHVREIVMNVEHVLQMHGFYLNEESKIIRLDTVISFDAKDRSETYREVVEKIQATYPGYTIQVAMDTDYSE